MAFKNAKLALTTSSATIYTCPASTVAIVLLCQVANIDGEADAFVSVKWTDASASNASTALASEIRVPALASLSCIDGKMVLEAGDTLTGDASADSALVVTVAVMEMVV